MPVTPRQLEQQLESKRGGLALALVGLGLGIFGYQAGRAAEQHEIARDAAAAGRIPDLRLYALGHQAAPPFRETLGATAPDLRPQWADPLEQR